MRIELENMSYIMANLSDKFNRVDINIMCMRNKFPVITGLINVRFIVVIDIFENILQCNI